MAFLNNNGLSHFWNTIKNYLRERYQDKHKRTVVTLPASAWSSNAMTVNAAGVTATNDIIVGARPDCNAEWTASGVYCSAQSNGVVSFSCAKTPTVNLYANILILNDAIDME